MAKRKKHDTAGQPKKWESKEKLQEDIKGYFDYCEEKERPMTIAGLAAHLGVSRQTIYNYSYKDEYFDIIKKAYDKIMAYLEEELMIKGSAGQIFIAKQYGYTDRQELSLEANDDIAPSIADVVKQSYETNE